MLYAPPALRMLTKGRCKFYSVQRRYMQIYSVTQEAPVQHPINASKLMKTLPIVKSLAYRIVSCHFSSTGQVPHYQLNAKTTTPPSALTESRVPVNPSVCTVHKTKLLYHMLNFTQPHNAQYTTKGTVSCRHDKTLSRPNRIRYTVLGHNIYLCSHS